MNARLKGGFTKGLPLFYHYTAWLNKRDILQSHNNITKHF